MENIQRTVYIFQTFFTKFLKKKRCVQIPHSHKCSCINTLYVLYIHYVYLRNQKKYIIDRLKRVNLCTLTSNTRWFVWIWHGQIKLVISWQDIHYQIDIQHAIRHLWNQWTSGYESRNVIDNMHVILSIFF